MPNDAAAEKAGSAESGDDAIVHGSRGSDSPAHLGAVSAVRGVPVFAFQQALLTCFLNASPIATFACTS
jgi:hypothetical protein